MSQTLLKNGRRLVGEQLVTCDILIEDGKAQVKMLHSHDKWYGVTYREDKPGVVAALARLTAEGVYPEKF